MSIRSFLGYFLSGRTENWLFAAKNKKYLIWLKLWQFGNEFARYFQFLFPNLYTHQLCLQTSENTFRVAGISWRCMIEISRRCSCFARQHHLKRVWELMFAADWLQTWCNKRESKISQTPVRATRSGVNFPRRFPVSIFVQRFVIKTNDIQNATVKKIQTTHIKIIQIEFYVIEHVADIF